MKDGFEGNKKGILLKKIYLLIKNIPQTNIFYNENRQTLENVQFPTEEPDFEVFNNYLEEQKLFYNNFIIMEKYLFDIIFGANDQYSQNMEYKNNYSDCINICGYIFIILNKIITTTNRIIIEIGHLDHSLNKFIL